MSGGPGAHWLPLLPGQATLLAPVGSGPAPLLISSGLFTGAPDVALLERVLGALTERHPALRTTLALVDGAWQRRVLDRWSPRLVTCLRRLAPPEDPVAAVHRTLGAEAPLRVEDPAREPAVCFVLTRVEPSAGTGPTRQVLSLMAHRALLDATAAAAIWQELGEAYPHPRAGGVPTAATSLVAADPPEPGSSASTQRAAALAGAPQVLTIPSDRRRPVEPPLLSGELVAGLSEAAGAALGELGGVADPAVVLLSAWALVLGRRAATDQLLLGVPTAVPGRPVPVTGPAQQLVPVHCRLDDRASVAELLRATTTALADALAAAAVPLAELVAALGGTAPAGRHPLVQVTLEVREPAPPAEPLVHTVQYGGSGLDLSLAVELGGDPRLLLRYAPAVITAEEAAELLDSLDATLVAFAAAPAASLSGVRTISPSQWQRLQRLRQGPAAAPPGDLWELVAAGADADPTAIAVRDAVPSRPLSYRQLVAAAEQQAAELAAAGVGEADHVVLALPRSAQEVVAVLGVLRLGAAYVPIDMSTPDARLRELLAVAAPRAVLGAAADATRVRRLAPAGCAVPELVDPWAVGRLPPPPPVPARPDRVAYVAFTSGSTGVPKGVRVPHRAVSRLVREVGYLRCGPGERVLRFAPLAFDASTLELFAPLVNGGTIEVYPDALPSPTELASFLAQRRVGMLWLTAGLFRIMVDVAPQAFQRVRQVLTGGDVVPAEQVRRLLARYPDLRVSNGYGPTENTTFTTVHHLDSPYEVEDPLPIGTPVPGTGVLVLDQAGQLLPPGAVGELYASGEGLACDYLADPVQTAEAMGRAAPDTGERLYRTGDVVRWDGRGRLHFLGRHDHQIKIRGFRVELTEVQHRISEHPAVQDAVVVVVGAQADARALLAAVVSDQGPESLRRLREHAEAVLPPHAVPTLWAAVEQIPVTVNGKVDREALEKVAVRVR